MFYNIFSFELSYWLKRPLFYIYCAIFFIISMLIMASSARAFENFTSSSSTIEIVNSAYAINQLLNSLTLFIYFLLPSIIGATLQKDFKYNTHSIIYSYPFTKWQYLSAKFLSGLVISLLVVLAAAFGIVGGSLLPWVNPDLLGPFNILNYLQPFAYYILPNLIFYGAVVFAVVTYSRSVNAGFMAILVLILIQAFAESLTQDIDNRALAALLDPFGSEANSYYTQYWTNYEKNINLLPFKGYIIYNRLLWTGIGFSILAGVYQLFGFRQQGISFKFWKSTHEPRSADSFGDILSVSLPSVQFDFSFVQNLKLAWKLSVTDFKYIVKGWPFIIISLFGLLISLSIVVASGEIYGTDTLPVTWQMLELPGGFFNLFINVLTFLYAGLLIQRARSYNMDQLIHATPAPDWALLLSKFLALIKMQFLLLSIIMVGGILIQLYNGFYQFQIGLYLFNLYGVTFLNVLVWGFLAFFIHTLFKNHYLGFILLLIISIGITFLGQVGIEQDVFKFNNDPGTTYSAMNGYGDSLLPYYIYKFYWLLLCIPLFILAILLYRRGMPETLKERLQMASKQFNPTYKAVVIISLVGFVAMGSWIYYVNNIKNEYVSSKESERRRAQWEIKYSKYQQVPQPRITDINVNLDLYPESRDFEANGTYILKNKTSTPIDSVHIDLNDHNQELSFSRPAEALVIDDTMNYNIYRLGQPLKPGDSLRLDFKVWNEPNSLLEDNSPVRNNGTFVNNSLFPRIGYQEQGELTNNSAREKYDLPPKERMAPPTDSAARMDNYIANDADWVSFETTISTAPNQIAIAPGQLQNEWEENGRRYFRYKMGRKMLNFYSYISADFEVARDRWNDVDIGVYYHKGHDYNIDRMIKGVKRGLDYYTNNYSPYQHNQVRIIEFPRTSGGFAQSFANTIPYSEAVGFIAQVDDSKDDALDYPFSITAHEVAHQWWAHQVIGANVKGATVLSESLSEYSSLKVLEKEYGKNKMRVFLKDALDKYLSGRTNEQKKEQPLIYTENQQYIHYNKGSLVMYALSDYIGEDNLNWALGNYVDSVAYQQPPYTTSLDLLSYLKKATPDSLSYLIKDMFETITLYDNRIDDVSYEKLENDSHRVSVAAHVIKYRSDGQGKRIYHNAGGDSLTLHTADHKQPLKSLPLHDWIEVGIFAQDEQGNEKVLYLEKHKFTSIKDTLEIIVNEKPSSAGIDPYNKLIDATSGDKRMDMN